MSTRASVVVQDINGSKVYLYQHYDGYELPSILKKSLDRGRSRWDDGPYLARIIFSDMIRDDLDGTTGYGISAYPIETVFYTVDCRNRVVELPNHQIKTFEEFIKD